MNQLSFSLFSLAPIISFFQTKLINILVALVVFLVGYFVIKALMSPLKSWLVKLKVDLSFHAFIIAVIKITSIVLLAVSCLGMSGLVESTSLITALGAVGLAISLAVKDSLSNLAGGMMVLFTKPFEVGDYVEACGHEGTVREIGIVHTVLKTVDNKLIYLPNGDVAKAQVTNFSAEPLRRLDIKFFIGYNSDFKKAEKIIIDVAEKSGLVLSEPSAPFARVTAHQSNSIEIQSRIWVKAENYWDLNFYMYEEVKTRFDQEGITIPYNQLDVHLNTNSNKNDI
ncbi:MAG: mechanosensitive ion channel [Oscillospiraceae bacterium]